MGFPNGLSKWALQMGSPNKWERVVVENEVFELYRRNDMDTSTPAVVVGRKMR
jgi:hypothetical protein